MNNFNIDRPFRRPASVNHVLSHQERMVMSVLKQTREFCSPDRSVLEFTYLKQDWMP